MPTSRCGTHCLLHSRFRCPSARRCLPYHHGELECLRYGGISKSNFGGLGFLDAVRGTVREVMISYYDMYYNRSGQKTFVSWNHSTA